MRCRRRRTSTAISCSVKSGARGGIPLSLQQLHRRAVRGVHRARDPRRPPASQHRVYNRRMSSTATASRTVGLGIDRLLDLDRSLVAGRRIGLVCNPASVDGAAPAHRRSAGRRSRRCTLAAHLRPAARVPVRPAGQHDRDAARATTRDARPGVFAVQRDARADGRDARGRRRAGRRPSGRRHPHLHLHLHDGQLPARRARGTASAWSSATGRIPIGGAADRRQPARPGVSRRSSGSSRFRCGTA